jgi:hypothetical protein
MIRIDGKSGITPTTTTSTRKSGGTGTGFRLESEVSSARSSSVSSASAIQNTEALLALQEEETPQQRKRRFVKRGRDLLDELDQLKAKLLAGHVTNADLKRLSNLLAQRIENVEQPEMTDLMRHIELRAHVEIAKLQRDQ